MFKNKIHIRIVIALAIGIITMSFFSSCEKEYEDSHNHIINDVLYPKNSKLKQISHVESVKIKETGMIISQFEYDSERRVSKVSKPMYESGTPMFENGKIVGIYSYSDYTYNGKGKLEKITDYHSNVNNYFLNLSTRTYTYNADGNKQKEVIVYHHTLPKQTDSTLYFYNKNRLTREERYEEGYFGSERWHSELITYIEYEYDSQGKLVKETKISGTDDVPFEFCVHSYQNRLLVKTEIFNAKDNQVTRKITLYYDKNENLLYLESREFDIHNSSMSFVAKYEYF